MIRVNREAFEGNEFSIQLLAKGAYVDNGTGDGQKYLIEAYTIRLNHIALNAWITSECMNCRECYQDGPAGDAEWNAHKAEYAERRRAWTEQIVKSLDIGDDGGSNCITQSLSEVFTVVHITKIG